MAGVGEKTSEKAAATTKSRQVSDLTEVVDRTFSDDGMDRMTKERVEELVATNALTAHL